MNSTVRFAHSLKQRPEADWEPLPDHLYEVGELAAGFAGGFGLAEAGRASGVLHDIGKTSDAFQAYIRGKGPSPDHSSAGACEAAKLYPGRWGLALGFAIAGHHAGLADGEALMKRLSAAPPAYGDWREHAAPPPRSALTSCREPKPGIAGAAFSEAFAIRMLFSALVDADFLATERFYASRETPPRPPDRGGFTELGALHARLAKHLADMPRPDTPINRLRATVLDHACAKARTPPGLFTLTVPTGGGKTLTSLAFALEHARCHGLRRVVYVIPYTSIIEQTAEVFRDVLASPHDPRPAVLEHHASFDWEAALPRDASPAHADAGEGRAGLAKLRRAAETWDAPVVVTTAVQFFESLFANRTSRCRKLHNLAQSVIVLDEAQTLPLHLLRPCLAALDELARNYGASVVLCTATQPAVRVQDGFKGGLDISPERELAPEPQALYARLKRVTVERRPGETSDAELAARMLDAPQMLTIVNSRAHARDLFDRIGHLPGATHLTTLMCARHRRRVLAQVRERLGRSEPVRLVATSLIEAGVDVSFPEVWRASAGLESILQAGGRCNRNDELAEFGRKGRVVVFDPGEAHPPPQALRAFQQAAESVLRRHPDPLTLEAVQDYFADLYWTKGPEALDAAKLEGELYPILKKIEERKSRRLFPFESIAAAFRMIDQAMEPVVVPYDDRAREVLDRIAAMDRPLAADLRVLQQYVVPLPRQTRADWLGQGVLTPVHEKLGGALVRFADLELYDERTGVRLEAPAYLPSEALVIS